MRVLPFMKRKKGFQYAGVGVGGSGGGSYTLPPATSEALGGIKVGSGLAVTDDGTLSTASDGTWTTFNIGGGSTSGSVTLETNVTDFDEIKGKMHMSSPGKTYIFPIPYKGGADLFQVYVEDGVLFYNTNMSGYTIVSGEIKVKNLVTSN